MIRHIPKVLLAGDSISFGYGPLVRQILEGVFTVENLPENGGTSSNLLVHIDEWMIEPRFDIIHLNCGLHDLAFERDTKKQRVLIDQYEENLKEIIRRLRKDTSSKIAWATSTPVIDELHKMRTLNQNKGIDRYERDVLRYNKAALNVMTQLRVPINDLHKLVEKTGVERCIGKDGVHMTDFGYNLLAHAVADFVSTLK